MELISKISVGAIYTSPVMTAIKKKFIGGEITEDVIALRVFGQATGAKYMSNTNGEFVKFTGAFRGVRPDTGEEYTSGAMFLPPIAENFLVGALNGVESGGVQFAFDLIMSPDETSVAGYVYKVKPLFDAGEADPLTMLAKQLPKMDAPKLALAPAEPKPEDKPKK